MKNRQKMGVEQTVQGALDFDGVHARPQTIEKRLYVAFSNHSPIPRETTTKNKASAMEILIAHAKSLSW